MQLLAENQRLFEEFMRKHDALKAERDALRELVSDMIWAYDQTLMAAHEKGHTLLVMEHVLARARLSLEKEELHDRGD